MNLYDVIFFWNAADTVCKSNPGGCREWKNKNLRREGGFYLEGGYSVEQCLDKCKEQSLCGMFLINKLAINGIPIGSCLLYREGCTIDKNNDFDSYDIKECTTAGTSPVSQVLSSIFLFGYY